jgi:membrane-bound serine protease (ClpP class)
MLWLGILLLVLAVALVIGELHTGSGFLFLLGLVSLIFGLSFLFTQSSLFAEINWWFVIPLIIVIIGLIILMILRIRNTYRHKVTTGKEDLEGQTARVQQTLDPEGMVFVHGEYWNAESKSGRIKSGDEVIIEKVEGLKLYVVKKPEA